MQKEIVEKLEQLRHKGGAWQSQEKAKGLLRELKALLPDEDSCKLSIAHSHYELGEGAGELYDVVNSLISKYRVDIPPRANDKTLL